jgi:hypothetical protein
MATHVVVHRVELPLQRRDLRLQTVQISARLRLLTAVIPIESNQAQFSTAAQHKALLSRLTAADLRRTASGLLNDSERCGTAEWAGDSDTSARLNALDTLDRYSTQWWCSTSFSLLIIASSAGLVDGSICSRRWCGKAT